MEQAISEAEKYMEETMKRYDPSHDRYHVARVRDVARAIALEVQQTSNIKIDMLVLELAATLHDVLDKKYALPEDLSDPFAFFLPFFESVSSHVDLVGDGRAALIVRIMENVSWSTEKALRANGSWGDWHESCIELHCVQDADRLDAIGAIGILRCAAYSAAVSRPLVTPSDDKLHPESCIQHFHDKLLHIRDRLKTAPGRRIGDKRHKTMEAFLQSIEEEMDHGAKWSRNGS